jgi:hypothetical protein
MLFVQPCRLCGYWVFLRLFADFIELYGFFCNEPLNKIVFMVYKVGFLVQVWWVMKPWQLRIALFCGRISRVEVLSLRCCGYGVQAITQAGHVRAINYAAGRALWPGLELIKVRLRRCGVRQVLFLQPESHDEIIGRPKRLGSDPGLWLRLR